MTEYLCSTGKSSIAYNLEIWDEKIFNEICPSKTICASRERIIRMLKEARDLLKPARALSSFVVGLEPKESVLAGIDYLSSEGIFPIMSPFVPMAGTEYEGKETTETEWVWDVHEKATEIIYKNCLKHSAMRYGTGTLESVSPARPQNYSLTL